MPDIQITDKFGLDIGTGDIEAVLKDPKDIRQSVALSFKQPVTLGSGVVKLTIDPTVSGSAGIAKDIPVPANQALVFVTLQAKLDTGGSGSASDLQFGFANESQIGIANYRLFPVTAELAPAIATVLQNFVIPGDIPDIESLPAGSIVTVDGSGSLKFTAEADLPASVNPLATVTDNLLKGALQVKAGGSMSVKATYTLTGEYQIRVQRLDGRRFQLGYEKQRSSELEFNVSVEAQAGVSATACGADLLQSLLKVVSADPVQAGLTGDEVSSIGAAVKTGIERSLQLALSAELDLLNQTSAAFSYQIDLDAADAAGLAAINAALDGDLTGLEDGPLPGIRPLKSVLSQLRQRKEILKLNLLGIFNVASVTTLLQSGKVIVDRDTGSITIADLTTATRIGFTGNNFAADSAKLRRVLADSLLMTAAYRASGTVPVAQFNSTQWFFELHQKTNPQNIKDYLNIAQALRIVSPFTATAQLDSLRSVAAFGRSMLSVSASYSDALFRNLFLDAGENARPQTEYENIGISALLALMPTGNPVSDARRLPLTDSGVWVSMKAAGQPNDFGGLFESRGFNANQLADIGVDYTLIMWWAGAMSGMATALAAILEYAAQRPHWDPRDNTMKSLRASLNKAMASVGKTTTNEFSEPFGLLALDLASGQKAPVTVQLACPKLSFLMSRQLT